MASQERRRICTSGASIKPMQNCSVTTVRKLLYNQRSVQRELSWNSACSIPLRTIDYPQKGYKYGKHHHDTLVNLKSSEDTHTLHHSQNRRFEKSYIDIDKVLKPEIVVLTTTHCENQFSQLMGFCPPDWL